MTESIYQRRIKAGNCGKCGDPREDKDAKMCHDCAGKERARSAARRVKTAANGMCSACAARPRLPNSSRCEKCKQTSAASTKRRQDRLKAAGLCVHCGVPVPAGRVTCEVHSQQMSKRATDKYHERKAAGTCCRCDEPVVNGQPTCEGHTAMAAANRKALRNKVLKRYGGKCRRCKETRIDQLEMSRIPSKADPATKGMGGHHINWWLKKNGFPKGFRILCQTCEATLRQAKKG